MVLLRRRLLSITTDDNFPDLVKQIDVGKQNGDEKNPNELMRDNLIALGIAAVDWNIDDGAVIS